MKPARCFYWWFEMETEILGIPARKCRLRMCRLLASCMLTTVPSLGQNVLNINCPNQVAAGGNVLCTIGLSFGAGVNIDSLTFGVVVTPDGVAPVLTTGQLSFSESISGSFNSTGGTGNSISTMWPELSPALSGGIALGSLGFTAPAAAASGQTYSVTFTGASASLGTNIVNISIGSAITVWITKPVLSVSSTSMSFSVVQGGADPANQTVAVSNIGGGTLDWSAAATSGSFLTLSGTASGTNGGTITAAVNAGSLTAGTYNGNIQVTAAGASN